MVHRMGPPLPVGEAGLAGSPLWDRKEDKKYVPCIWSQYGPALVLSSPLLGERQQKWAFESNKEKGDKKRLN